MSVRNPSNLAMSIHARLLNRIRERGLDPTRTFTLYALERLLLRLCRSRHADRFILKGAMLFAVWEVKIQRPTRDLDLLGLGDLSENALRQTLREICETPVEPDGLEYDAASTTIEDIRAEDEYVGKRARMLVHLGTARIPIQIDIGVGDAVTTPFRTERFPTLLDMPAPEVLAYTRETAIAEKFQAMVDLGVRNSRMKDFFDIWTLARLFPFEGDALRAALGATFARRNTPVETATHPLAFTADFADAPGKTTQWAAFLRQIKADPAPPFPEVAAALAAFLLPVTSAMAAGAPFARHWPPNGPWQEP